MERVNSKIVEIDGRTFIVSKMDAMESLAVLKELLTRALPFDLFAMLGSAVGSADVSKAFGMSSDSKKDMSIDEFVALQKRILRYCSEKLPSGLAQVIDKNGYYGVNDISDNLDLITTLLMESVRLNYESFFIEKLQKIGLLEKVKAAVESQTNLQTE